MARKNKPLLSPSPEKPHWWLEIIGFFLLIAIFLMLLSLWCFEPEAKARPWTGLVGSAVGGTLHYLFGLGSYLLLGYLGWIAWAYLTHRPPPTRDWQPLSFCLFLASFCILACLVEESYPSLKLLGGNAYLRTPSKSFPDIYPFHLGGTPFYVVYKELPLANLVNLLNHLGIAIVFTALLIASGLLLTETGIKSLIHQLKQLAWRKEKAHSLPSSEEKEEGLRFVKLKTAHSESLESPHTPPSQELLPINPSANLKERPSISQKNYVEGMKSPYGIVWPEIKRSLKSPPPSSSDEEATPPASKPSARQEPAETAAPPRPPKAKVMTAAALSAPGDYSRYQLPALTLLTEPVKGDQSQLKKGLRKQAEVLEETLLSFGIEAKVGQINCGPTITSFEVHPAIGVKVQKIKALENDIALNMEAQSIRIIAPIPGKAAVGIEVPNPQPQEVGFKDMLQAYLKGAQRFRIPILLGKTVNGDYVTSDLTKMPHCIIAGATGSGKSVCINTLIMSILLTARPDEIRLLMIDPKKVELTPYSRLPHMLAPVITEPHEACAALQWLVREMEQRYEFCKEIGVRNIDGYNNRKVDPEKERAIAAKLKRSLPEKLPYYIAIVDELADLMMVASRDIETPIARIAQMARAVGIHLILATQRPSREVITGLIKANFPTRISFKVASRVNSQIVLDDTGAESLLGNGDMLFLPPGSSHLIRAQGAYIRDEDINKVICCICEQSPPHYITESFATWELGMSTTVEEREEMPLDDLYDEAHELVTSTGNASTTFLQRKLKIGYARAASLMDQLEAQGIVSPADGSKPRRLLVSREEDQDSQ